MGMIHLAEISTRAPKELEKSKTKEKSAELLTEISDLQNLLYASSTNSLLVILQGMDASGKDGAIRSVFSSVNPQGISVSSFKVPTDIEAAHDFLWRIHQHTPARGMIQVFNRSHYEDILITRVHKWCDDKTAVKRMKAINDFEDLVQQHNNTSILKFYLHISHEEQKERLDERVHNPAKQWKYNEGDLKEADHWDQYMKVYEECMENCNLPPWIIVPSDQNWYKEYIILKNIRDALLGLKLSFPKIKKKEK
ncbi:MAG TPA: PPK2 family polyphosphate kinase [Flavitalea sp.]|nr:PPK2 family polyphosphate kinase [Flavitalea sp.]